MPRRRPPLVSCLRGSWQGLPGAGRACGEAGRGPPRGRGGGDAAEKAAPATVPAGKLAELLLMEGNGGTRVFKMQEQGVGKPRQHPARGRLMGVRDAKVDVPELEGCTAVLTVQLVMVVDMEYKLRPGMITLTWTQMKFGAYKKLVELFIELVVELVGKQRCGRRVDRDGAEADRRGLRPRRAQAARAARGLRAVVAGLPLRRRVRQREDGRSTRSPGRTGRGARERARGPAWRLGANES